MPYVRAVPWCARRSLFRSTCERRFSDMSSRYTQETLVVVQTRTREEQLNGDSQADMSPGAQEEVFPHDINVDIEAPELVERTSWLRWCPTSMAALRDAERRIMSFVKTAWRGRFVDIGSCVNEEACKVWTISFNEKSKKTPLVLVHGFAAGVALWSLNFDTYAAHRPVYAFDLPGFGRSSRPSFSANGLEAEAQLVKSIEEWRKEIDLDRMVLLGHSMGGFLAAAYALRHPERVEHLILADPWGFPERPPDAELMTRIPFWARAIATLVQPFNALATIRVAGPWGPNLVKRARPDLARKFANFLGDENMDLIPHYIYHCNAQNPSGEGAFHAMSAKFGWAKHPMLNRMDALNPDVPVTVVHGSKSWVSVVPEEVLRAMRPKSYVKVETIPGAGHHVYADKAEDFNKIVFEACTLADEARERRLRGETSRQESVEGVVESEDSDVIVAPSE